MSESDGTRIVYPAPWRNNKKKRKKISELKRQKEAERRKKEQKEKQRICPHGDWKYRGMIAICKKCGKKIKYQSGLYNYRELGGRYPYGLQKSYGSLPKRAILPSTSGGGTMEPMTYREAA